MISFTRLGIPIIASLILVGLVSFIVVFSLYPEKHENIEINGKCYELKGVAHTAYNNLSAQSKKYYLTSLLSKISNSNAIVPITFTGQNTEIDKFIDKYNVAVTSQQKVIFYPNINGSVIIGNISETTLSGIVNNLSIIDLLATSKSIQGTISIMPNKQITHQEFRDVSLLQNQLLQNGLRSIVKNSEGVSHAECRYQPANMSY